MSGALQAVFQSLRSFLTPFGWINESVVTLRSQLERVTSDSSGKIYAVGSVIGVSTDRKLTVSRFTSRGTADLNVAINGANAVSSDYGGIRVDSSGNIYAILVYGTGNGIQLTKWNSSGALQFQIVTNTAGGYVTKPSYAIIDADSNIYVGVYHLLEGCYGNTNYQAIIKYNSSGAIVWQYRYNQVTSDMTQGIAADSAGNLYALTYGGYLLKTNSSGISSIVKYTTNGAQYFRKIAIDSSDNVYAIGSEASSQNMSLFKLTTSLTATWARKFVLGTSMDTTALAVDSTGDIYVVGVNQTTGQPGRSIILKYNSSGTLQWQRTVTGPGNSASYYTRFVDVTVANGNLNIVGYVNTTGVSTSYYGIAFSVPTDGSRTGTIVVNGNSYVYAASSGTESAGTLALSTGTTGQTTLNGINSTTAWGTQTGQITNTVTTF